MLRIGIIGCGAIGSALARAVEKRFRHVARLAYISDIRPEQIENFRKKIKSARFRSVSTDELIRRSDMIIEAASQEAARVAIPEALRQGKDVFVLSVGGVLRVKNLTRLLARSSGRVYIPSGAIAGIDAILAAKSSEIKRIRITTRKPLKSLLGAPYFSRNGIQLGKIRKPTLIFEGSAQEAIRYFPQNINVAATLSLAGLGPRKTRVRIFTSPTYRYNIHEVEIEGRFGRMISKVVNIPSKENPKTSTLAIGSAIATLEKIFSRVRVGT